MSLDLIKIKERKEEVLDLKKKSGLETQKAQVILALDYSGSMGGLYRDGTVQEVVEKILPFGLAFDDNGEVDFYLFENGSKKMPENITLKNLDGYINNKVMDKYSMGGTKYAPVLKQIHKDFSARKGLFGFGASSTMDEPVYVIFITDGENSDHSATESIVREMSNSGFFIQFIGIGSERFNFLDRLDNLSGRKLDNANFFKVSNIRTESDSNLYSSLMDEFPGWVTEARKLSLIK